MKYFSLDIETTGLDKENHQVLEIGGVIDDLETPLPLSQLPEFHCYVTHDVYNVSEYCLGLHTETGIFDDLSDRKDEHTYLRPNRVAYHIGKFVYDEYLSEKDLYTDKLGNVLEWKKVYDELVESGEGRHIIPVDDFLPMSVVAAGKNFNSFDSDFINQIPNIQDIIRFHHRVVDPGPMYLKSTDEKPPNLKTCLERAGIGDEVPHNAVDDSKLVVKLIRNHFGIELKE